MIERLQQDVDKKERDYLDNKFETVESLINEIKGEQREEDNKKKYEAAKKELKDKYWAGFDKRVH